MFCDATTPTPDRAWAQRAATAGEDDETAMAMRPVRGQRAAIENVIGSLPSFPPWLADLPTSGKPVAFDARYQDYRTRRWSGGHAVHPEAVGVFRRGGRSRQHHGCVRTRAYLAAFHFLRDFAGRGGVWRAA